MTTIAVFADPPRPGLVLDRLVRTGPLDRSAATALYTAMLQDVLRAVDRSGGELLLNYRPDELLPEPHRTGDEVPDELRPVAEEALGEAPRMEIQVGSNTAARVGNTITHLLEREEVQSAAYVPPNAPLLSRTHVDSAAMKLRRTPVVLGPDHRGGLFYAGFTDPIRFDGVFDPPALLEHTARADEDGLAVDFLPMIPTVETASDLALLIVHVRARELAGLATPTYTARWIESTNLEVVVEDGELSLIASGSDGTVPG